MSIAHLDVDAALASLRSSSGGLSAAEAQRRRTEYGPNRIERIRGEPLGLQFARQFVHFFVLLLWLAAGLAFFAETGPPARAWPPSGW